MRAYVRVCVCVRACVRACYHIHVSCRSVVSTSIYNVNSVIILDMSVVAIFNVSISKFNCCYNVKTIFFINV